jgi:hypothetical protein
MTWTRRRIAARSPKPREFFAPVFQRSGYLSLDPYSRFRYTLARSTAGLSRSLRESHATRPRPSTRFPEASVMITRSLCSSRRRPSSALPDFGIINNRVFFPVWPGSKRSNIFDLHLLYIGGRGRRRSWRRAGKKEHLLMGAAAAQEHLNSICIL